MRASVPALVASSGLFAKFVLIVLLAVSAYSWAVIWNRLRLYSRIERANREFLAAFRRLAPGTDSRLMCEQHPNSLLARVALAGLRALEQHPAESKTSPAQRYEFAQRAMDRSANDESASLERHIDRKSVV